MYKIVPNPRNNQCTITMNRWELRTENNEFVGCFARKEVAEGVKEALEKYRQEEIKEINAGIIRRLREKESKAREAREMKGKKVYGAYRLRTQKILQPHTPKKKSRKVFVMSSVNKLRMELIADYKEFCTKCRECLRRWRSGEYDVRWPPGAFKPPLPPLVNLLPA